VTKKSIVEREKKRKILSDQFFEKRAKIRKMRNNKSITIADRLGLQVMFNKLSNDTAKMRGRGRCLITGRPRGYYRKFGLSRIKLREMASWGMIPGLLKSSW